MPAEDFLFCNAGTALLGVAIHRRTPAHRPAGALALLTGLVGLSGLACIAAHIDLGLGRGGVERLTAYTFPIWISGVGAWLLRGRLGGPRSPAIAADPRGRPNKTIHRTGVVRFAMLAAALGGLCSAAVAEEKPTSAPASAICIVPLSPLFQDARTDAPAPNMKQDAIPEVLPGMPGPLLALQDFPGRWIIDADRRLVPYDGFWPVHSYLDKGGQARESWSSRTVASTYNGGVSVLRPGAARFEEIPGSHEVAREHGAFSGPFVLPHRKETVVTASDGAAYWVEDKTLVPWMSPEDFERHGVAGVSRVFESRFLRGDVVLDNNYRLSVLTDDGDWRGVASLGREDFGDFADAPESGVTIFFGQYHAAVISPNGRSGFAGWTVARNYLSWAGNDFHVSELFGEAFYFGTSRLLDFGNPRWLRVTPAGFTEIEGSSRVVLSGSAILDGHRQQSVRDLSSIHSTLFQGRDGFYLYDGHAIVPVPNSGPDVVGPYPKFLDMPTLRRSLVEGQTGIFEATPDGRLKKVALPPDVSGLREWPQAHVGLASDEDAVYGLNADLTFHKTRPAGLAGARAYPFGFDAQHRDGRRLDFVERRALPGGDGRGTERRRLS